MSHAKPYAAIPFLSNARATIALEQTRDRAEEKGDAELVALAGDALSDQAAWRAVINAWIAQNRSNARQGGETFAIDAEADFVLGGIFDNVEKLARRRGNTDAGRAAKQFITEHFTDARGQSGVGVMSKVIYEDQLPRMRAMMAWLADNPDLARLLRIGEWVEELAEILPRYAASLEATTRITWGEVIALRNTAYDSLFAVVGLIFARFRRDPATLGYLLAPLDDQVARAADLARRRRAGQSMAVNEDELSAEELAELEGAAEDVDGDGVADGLAADGEAAPAVGGPDGPDAAEGERAPILRPLPGVGGDEG